MSTNQIFTMTMQQRLNQMFEVAYTDQLNSLQAHIRNDADGFILAQKLHLHQITSHCS